MSYKVLVVDDEVEVCKITRFNLKREGYNVIETTNPIDALNTIRNNEVDILVIDYFMPEMTGEEVIREVRTFNKELPIILQTGYAGEKPANEMIKELDIQNYHSKDEGIEKLIVAIWSAVKTIKLIKEIKQHYTEIVVEKQRLSVLGELLGTVSHNMKNIIASVGGKVIEIQDLANEYKESLTDNDVTIEDHIEIASDISKAAYDIAEYNSFMGRLIRSVKDQSVQYKNNDSENVFKVYELLRDVELLSKDFIKRHSCILRKELDACLYVNIKGRIIDLIQVIINLFNNAVEAYKDKDVDEKIIVFELRKSEKDKLMLIVRDYAGGIPENLKGKLFSEMITSKGKEGTGIGLYTSKKVIVEKFDGKMWFDSDDKETTFYIELPAS